MASATSSADPKSGAVFCFIKGECTRLNLLYGTGPAGMGRRQTPRARASHDRCPADRDGRRPLRSSRRRCIVDAVELKHGSLKPRYQREPATIRHVSGQGIPVPTSALKISAQPPLAQRNVALEDTRTGPAPARTLSGRGPRGGRGAYGKDHIRAQAGLDTPADHRKGVRPSGDPQDERNPPRADATGSRALRARRQGAHH